jgi:hypothetical protein
MREPLSTAIARGRRLAGTVLTAVRQACEAAGSAFGVAGALDNAPPALCAGASILVHGTDARLCAGAVDAAAAWMRGALERGQELM